MQLIKTIFPPHKTYTYISHWQPHEVPGQLILKVLTVSLGYILFVNEGISVPIICLRSGINTKT